MQQIVYISSPDSQQIYVWQLESNNVLTLLQIIKTPGVVQPIVLNPNKNFLYAGVRPNFGLLTYKILSDGSLTLINQSLLPGSPTHLSTDKKGKYIFCSSYNFSCLALITLDQQGIPQSVTQVINGLKGCHFANVDITNRKLFVTSLKNDCIYLFNLEDNGKLSPYKDQEKINTIKGSGPRHMAFHPNGKFAYSINELNGNVDIWKLNDNVYKYIKLIESINISSTNSSCSNQLFWAADINISPDGSLLYTSERHSSILTIFNVMEGGSKLFIRGFQLTEEQPRGFSIDLTGNYLVAAGQKSNHISLYAIQSQGILTPLIRYATGNGPMCVVFHQLHQKR